MPVPSLSDFTLHLYMVGWPARRVHGEPFNHYKIRRKATNKATKLYLKGRRIS